MYGAASSVDRADSDGRAEERADRAGHAEAEHELPVDVAEAPVRRARDQRGADLGQVHGRAGGGRADAGQQEQRRRRDAVGHAEGAVDELGAEAHESEDDQSAHGVPSGGQTRPAAGSGVGSATVGSSVRRGRVSRAVTTSAAAVPSAIQVGPASSRASAEANRTAVIDGPDQPARAVGGQARAEIDAGQRAQQQRRGERELHVAEEQVPERRGPDQRDRLHDVGADEVSGPQPGIGDEQHRDDQRSGTDRRQADGEPADDADRERHQRADRRQFLGGLLAARPPGGP